MTCGRLLHELQEARVLVPLELPETSWQELQWVLSECRKLPVIPSGTVTLW